MKSIAKDKQEIGVRVDELRKLKKSFDGAREDAKTEILAYGPVEYLDVLIKARINDLEFSSSIPTDYPIISNHIQERVYKMKGPQPPKSRAER